MHMTGSTTRILGLGLLMLSALSGCMDSPTNSAIDRIKPTAAAHADALAGDDMVEARKTGLALIVQLSAYAGWSE
jgi:hypothetical protein